MDFIRSTHLEDVRVQYASGKLSTWGTLFITASHTFFMQKETREEMWIPASQIDSIDRLPVTPAGSPLSLRCKNFRQIRILFQRDRDAQEVYNTLNQLSRPEQVNSLFAFNWAPPKSEQNVSAPNGWTSYDLRSEFMRMGVPNEYWAETKLNRGHALCDTYPETLFLPSSVDEATIRGCARFRSRSRLPVLTYLHTMAGAGRVGSAIVRCSQPFSGISNRSEEDERFLKAIVDANPHSDRLCIVDTRPKINALANRAMGKGYENEAFYRYADLNSFAIENIHVMRASLGKLLDILSDARCLQNASSFINALDATSWLKHVRMVLECSTFIAQKVEDGTSVLVHCSDGWDRTAQCCALAQIILDPLYRTLEGFQMLIEKDFILFGHKFLDRLGMLRAPLTAASSSDEQPAGGGSGGERREQAPIFIQFLDAVYQLTLQFPRSFEFNERYLIALHDAATSGQFGTFLSNCEADRIRFRLSERTHSFWTRVARATAVPQQRAALLNPAYDREREFAFDCAQRVLRVNLSPQAIRFWSRMYARFDDAFQKTPDSDLLDELAVVAAHSDALSFGLAAGTQQKQTQPQPQPQQPLIAAEWKSDSSSLRACKCGRVLNDGLVPKHCVRCGTTVCEECLRYMSKAEMMANLGVNSSPHSGSRSDNELLIVCNADACRILPNVAASSS